MPWTDSEKERCKWRSIKCTAILCYYINTVNNSAFKDNTLISCIVWLWMAEHKYYSNRIESYICTGTMLFRLHTYMLQTDAGYDCIFPYRLWIPFCRSGWNILSSQPNFISWKRNWGVIMDKSPSKVYSKLSLKEQTRK